MKIRRPLAAAVITLLAGAALGAPQSDPVASPEADVVVVSAAEPGDDPAGPGPDLTPDWPNSFTWRGAQQRSASQDADEAAPSDTVESPDQRSALSGLVWPPHLATGSQHSRHSTPWGPLQLSAETLRQCSSAEGRQSSDGEERRGGGSGNRPVLRAVGCTQAVLRDGQQAILAQLDHLQAALWEKVAYLKSCIEDVLEEVRLLKGGAQTGELAAIEDAIAMLTEAQERAEGYLEEFKVEVSSDMSMLKRGQAFIMRKLVTILGHTDMLKDGTAWLKRTVERLREVFDKKTDKLKGGQNDIKEKLTSLERFIKERLDKIELTDDGINENVKNLAVSIGMIKTELASIQTSLGAVKDMVLEDTKKLLMSQGSIIKELEEIQRAISNSWIDYEKKLSMIKEILTTNKNKIISELKDVKEKQDKILEQLDGIPNTGSDLAMIKANQGKLGTAIDVNKMKIMAVDDKLSDLATKFVSFASVQNDLSLKLMAITSAVTDLSKKLEKCCDKLSPPNCGRNEIPSDGKCFGCPDNFEVKKEGDKILCYFFSDSKENYSNARDSCIGKASKLATMTESNKELIFEFNDNTPGEGVWIGLTMQDDEWMWEDGTLFSASGFNLFEDAQFNQECGAASKRRNKNIWVDEPCTANKFYVCQTDAVKV